MDEKQSKRLLPLIIYNLLAEETNEKNPMSTTDILDALDKLGLGIGRKTLYDHIDLLNEAGFEVMRVRSQSNEYYVSDRKFDRHELRILIDAVRAAAFVTDKKTAELVGKIATLSGKRNAEVLNGSTVEFNTKKNTNEHIFYSIDKIAEAIEERKKIEFLYFGYDVARNAVFRKDKKRYVVSPFATVCYDNNYYLLCYHDNHDGITHYRVDRMDAVRLLDEPVSEPEWLAGFDIKKHVSQVFGMFGGEGERVTFRADRTLIDVIFDKFGKGVELKETDGDEIEFSADIQLSPPFFTFMCGFGDRLRVTSPASVVQRLVEHIDSVRKAYK